MDFGRTFVGLDPDGHRLRVFAPAPEEGAGLNERLLARGRVGGARPARP